MTQKVGFSKLCVQIKKKDVIPAILLSKYDSAEKKLNYAYMLKNGIGRYNIFFFNLYTKLAESYFLCHFRLESVNVFSRIAS
jgi:hypothetical protein